VQVTVVASPAVSAQVCWPLPNHAATIGWFQKGCHTVEGHDAGELRRAASQACTINSANPVVGTIPNDDR
jgi:hypothetical protein